MIAVEALGCNWEVPPSDLVLESAGVHIWFADLDTTVDQLMVLSQCLSGDEQIRAQSFHFERNRKRFIAARGLLRRILGLYLRIEPFQVVFRYGQYGKPAIARSWLSRQVQFNVSHSGAAALFAVTYDRQIGVDIEQIRPISLAEIEQSANAVFSSRERIILRGLSRSERRRAFFNCWTRKEAFVKAVGDGLQYPWQEFDVSLHPADPARLLAVKGNREGTDHWFLQDLVTLPGHAAALAIESRPQQTRYWRWPSGAS